MYISIIEKCSILCFNLYAIQYLEYAHIIITFIHDRKSFEINAEFENRLPTSLHKYAFNQIAISYLQSSVKSASYAPFSV